MKDIKIIIAKTIEEIKQVNELYQEYNQRVIRNFIESGFITASDPIIATFNTDSLPGKFIEPTGFLVLSFMSQQPVGCQFVRKLSHDTCELKRFYIRPEAGGTGLALKMLDFSVAEARAMGFRFIRLSSHTFMSKAVGIYRKYRFYEIPNYIPDDPLQAGNIQMEFEIK
jgi:ribosomal protein S18 acetylase RimI-like enzyme